MDDPLKLHDSDKVRKIFTVDKVRKIFAVDFNNIFHELKDEGGWRGQQLCDDGK